MQENLTVHQQNANLKRGGGGGRGGEGGGFHQASLVPRISFCRWFSHDYEVKFNVSEPVPCSELFRSFTFSGGSRPSAMEGARLTMNVEFCKDNSDTSKKIRYFRKIKVGARAPRDPPLDPPLSLVIKLHFLSIFTYATECQKCSRHRKLVTVLVS